VADHRPTSPLFGYGSFLEVTRIAAILRRETVGGALLLTAAVLALVWANSPWSGSYEQLQDVIIGPSALHLDLTLGEWAADGLLAIFFFVAGLELKREFVAGDLREPRRAVLPVLAAVGGMIMPAVLFILINLGTGEGALQGWVIPTATDIAFALAVLASRKTPTPTRTASPTSTNRSRPRGDSSTPSWSVRSEKSALREEPLQ
jgi:NhaA family Na+:H+ antiporter